GRAVPVNRLPPASRDRSTMMIVDASPCDLSHPRRRSRELNSHLWITPDFALTPAPWAKMPAHGAITFGELVGKLGRLRIDCPKCGRSGQYRLAVFIAKYGRDQKLSTWLDKLTADCPGRSRRIIRT